MLFHHASVSSKQGQHFGRNRFGNIDHHSDFCLVTRHFTLHVKQAMLTELTTRYISLTTQTLLSQTNNNNQSQKDIMETHIFRMKTPFRREPYTLDRPEFFKAQGTIGLPV